MTRPIDAPAWVKSAIFVGGAILLLIAALQVAGLIFCGVTGAARPQDVTPYTFYQYWYWYSQHPVWRSYLYGSGAFGGLALLMPVVVVLAPNKRRKLHGDARWAKRAEIVAAGLLGHAGIIIGKLGGKFLMFNGTEQGKNVIVAAAPGSGKTQGLMIPNCLNWPGSLVGLDIKGECYAVVIAAVGCLRGLQTRMGAQGVGLSATSAVVSGIFLIIVVDAVLTVLFSFV